MDEVTITLPRQRLDYIINVLATRPYGEVAETLNLLALQMQMPRSVGNGVDTNAEQKASVN